MPRKIRQKIRLFHIATDTLLIAGSWCGAYWFRQMFTPYIGVELSPFSSYLKTLPLVVLTWLFSCWFFGIYKNVRIKTGVERTQDLIRSAMLGWLLTTAIAFYFKEYHLGRTVILLNGLLNLLALSISLYAFHRVERRSLALRQGEMRALILGTNSNAIRLLQRLLEHPETGYNVIGFLAPDPSQEGTTLSQRPVWGGLPQLKTLLEQYDVDEVFVCVPELGYQRFFPMILECEALGVGFWMLSHDFEALDRNHRNIPQIEDIPLHYLGVQHESPLYPSIKRAFDFFAALLLLILSAPFWLWWILRIKLDSPGPALFVQTRVGQNGKLFRMYKFRTMRTDVEAYAEAPRHQKDDRITSYGRWLRRTSIDEIPQLLNVLKGDMSLVGPRPEMPFIVETYTDWQRCRLRVKPGLTGLWQILGRKDLPMQDNLQYDFYYIRNRSLLLDFSILFRTLLVIFGGKGAY